RLVPAEHVRENDGLRGRHVETVAVDGVIRKGQTSIDQSVMTGEPLPVDKQAGDDVFSGTVNQFGAFEMVATKVGENSSLQRMIRLVESADAGKAKIVGIADRWATWIVVIALLSAIATWAVTGEAVRAVTILVVFCPCALVLATPTAIMAGIGNATSYGILVREGDALERLAAVSRIAFDKTGTLTLGQPAVVGVESVNPAISAEQLLQHAAMAELHSEHPLGKAVVAYCTQRKEGRPAEPDAFAMLAGRGVIAEKDGKKILAGNETLLRENNIELTDAVLAAAETAKKSGGTVIFVAIDNQPAGIVTLSDTIRPDAAQTVKAIHDTGIQTILLTGDGPLAASHMSSLAGISDCRSSCLPEDKMSVIKNYQDKGVAVCMVGDGINDAPALKTASVGIAMGAVGSDISIEAADIALVGDNIRDIPHLLRLAKRTMRTINVNLTASMALNFVAIGLAVAGLLNPVLGALVHNAGSVAVIINSSLLLKWKGQ
ncbi:MAG: cation-translocating P-type ATPase, partial [Planctomycetes bacterium]|nr:cation-translocating P-type ATPase [Planctomycetota bacterium]